VAGFGLPGRLRHHNDRAAGHLAVHRPV